MKRAQVTNDAGAYFREHLETYSAMVPSLRSKELPNLNCHMLDKEAGRQAEGG